MAERLFIDHLGHLGDGVAVTSGAAVYVPGALPGETVDVEDVVGNAGRLRIVQIVSASPKRISPVCPHFGVCGGCAVQHWDAECYRMWKRDLVVEALDRVGLHCPVADLVDAHGAGRRRAVLHARRGTHEVLEVGFSAARAHRVVAIDRCPVLAKSLDGAIKVAWEIAEALGPSAKPLDLHVTATDAGLDLDVRGSGSLSTALVSSLARIADKRASICLIAASSSSRNCRASASTASLSDDMAMAQWSHWCGNPIAQQSSGIESESSPSAS